MTKYYLTFKDTDAKAFSADGGPFYEISSFNPSILQNFKSGFQTNAAGAGKITGDTWMFALRSSQLGQKIDRWLTSGAKLDQIDVVGFDTGANGKPVPVIRVALKVIGLKSNATDASNWSHNITVRTDGFVENATPLSPNEKQVAGIVDNYIRDARADSILTSHIENLVSPPLFLPDPVKVIAPSSAKSNLMYARLRDASGNVVGSGWIELENASLGSNQPRGMGSQLTSHGATDVKLAPPTPSFTPATIEFSPQQTEAAGQEIETITFAIHSGVGANQAVPHNPSFGATEIPSSRKTATDAGNVNYTVRYGSEQIATYTNGSLTSARTEGNWAPNPTDSSLASGFPQMTQSIAHSPVAPTIKSERASIACFSGGAHLQTERGFVAVETLRIGDRLLTLSGEHEPIVWIGRRRYVCGGHPNPEQVWPVVVAAGAFGEGLPERDLIISPGHVLYVEGGLVQAIRLVNGATIRQAPVAEIDYWRVDLPAHAVIYAEGLLSGTYIDNEHRVNFEGGDNMVQHPDFGPKRWDETCIPYLDDAELPALRERLLRRAEDFGFCFEADPDLHAIADGRRIEPVRLDENRFAFVFPPGVTKGLLASRAWRPLEATPDNQDPRTLGVCLSRLEVDGSIVDLADETLTEGWNEYEPNDQQRWTTGRASLPAGLRIALLDVCSVGRYLRRPRPFALEA